MKTDEERSLVRARLARIEADNDGRLTPDAVLVDAQDPESPLHDYFEWDNDKAAAAYRIEQARTLITSVRVTIKTETRSVRSVYYVRDPSAENQQQGYVSVDRLRTDADLAREAIVAEFARVADLLRRARELAAVLGAEHDVESLLQSVIGMRQRFMQPPTQHQ
jgi:hypothetical protein